VRTATFLTVAAVSAVVLVYKLRDLRRGPRNPFLQSFCLTILLIGSAFVVGVPAVLSRLEQATGVLAIWTTGIVVLGCAAVQTTLLLWMNNAVMPPPLRP
jgi:hypothetical protein